MTIIKYQLTSLFYLHAVNTYNIFKNNANAHPFLCIDGVNKEDLNKIIDYVNTNEILIDQKNTAIRVVEQKIKENVFHNNKWPPNLDWCALY